MIEEVLRVHKYMLKVCRMTLIFCVINLKLKSNLKLLKVNLKFDIYL